jgi:sugar diacid utilization regulator
MDQRRTDSQCPAIDAFAKIAGELGRLMEMDDLLHLLARTLSDLVGVERYSLHLRDDEAGLFHGRVGHTGTESIDSLVKRASAGMQADGMSRELLESRRPVIIVDARADPRIVRSTVRFWQIRSLMAVPLLLGDEVLGIAYLDDVDRAHEFSDADQELALAFGELAGIAIDRMKTTLQLRSELEAVNRQNAAFRRAAALDDRLSALVVEGRSLEELIAVLAEALGKPCALYDDADERVAFACPPGCAEDVAPRLLEAPYRDKPEVQLALHSLAESRGGVVAPVPTAGVLHRHYVAPVTAGGEAWGTLILMEHKRRFTGADILTARRAATLIALHMSAERKVRAGEATARASLTAELVAGDLDEVEARRRAEHLGLNPTGDHVVCLIAARGGGRDAVPDVGWVGAALDEIEAVGSVLTARLRDGVVAVIECPKGAARRYYASALRQPVAEVCEQLTAGAELVAGISAVYTGPEALSEAYEQARQVVQCIERFSPPGSGTVFTAEELGAGRLFLATSDEHEASRFALQTLGELVDDPARSDLLATLCQFFAHQASIRRCAADLGVHENTIRYRLAKAEELAELPFTRDPDAQTRAQISLAILQLQGRIPVEVAPRQLSAL